MTKSTELLDFDTQWKTGSRAVAKAIASTYVAAHFDELEQRFGGADISTLVSLIDHYRATGEEDQRILVDMWLIDKVAPQNIVGAVN